MEFWLLDIATFLSPVVAYLVTQVVLDTVWRTSKRLISRLIRARWPT